MTNESNENLLKILLNDPEEQPESSSGHFERGGAVTTINTYEITYDQLQYNGYTIGLDGVIGGEGGYVYLYDKNGTMVMRKKPVSNGITYNVVTIDIDKDGNLYGLTDYDNKTYLAYFSNVFTPDTEGNYDIKIKKSYNITPMLREIYTQIGPDTSVFNTDIKKSPIDSSFLITWAYQKNNTYSLVTILYHVNFEGDNDYKYKYTSIGTQGFNWIKNVEPTWTDTGVSFSDVIMSANYDNSVISTREFYKVTGTLGSDDNSAITSTLMLRDTSSSEVNFNRNTSYTTWISKNAVQNGNDIYFVNNSVTDNKPTTMIYHYNTELKVVWAGGNDGAASYIQHSAANMVKVNGQCFAWVFLAGTVKNYIYFIHLLGEECKAYELTPEGTTGYMGFLCLIQNAYNLYDIIMPNTDITEETKKSVLIYRTNGYNGDPYFNDESVTPAYSTIYGLVQSGTSEYQIMPVFSRDLYNSFVIGNTITSVVQIPYNYLNDTTIKKTDILSKTANIINETSKNIAKNMYEELYLNNQNSYRVYDNNVGSTYNQECTLKVVNNIFNSFTDNYKITKYRINYNDGTYENKPVSYTEIDGNEGTIRMYIYLTKPGKNIELYDNNFTVPFLTIDISSFDIEKIYQVVQKIKVE
jgi:hypothetical protein